MNRDKPTLLGGSSGGRPPDKPTGEPTIDRTSQSRIGDHLRAMYDGLMQQPVPDRFVDLISRLEDSSEAKNCGR